MAYDPWTSGHTLAQQQQFMIDDITESHRLLHAGLPADTTCEMCIERGPDGLAVTHEWVRVGGVPVWRGYDPTQPRHIEREAAFIRHVERRGLAVDRCFCGGLAAWDEHAEDANHRLDAHYPPQFVAQAHQRVLSET